MDKKKILKNAIVIVAGICFLGLIMWFNPFKFERKEYVVNLSVDYDNVAQDVYQIFYLTEDDEEDAIFYESQSIWFEAKKGEELSIILPSNTTVFRLDLGNNEEKIEIEKLYVSSGNVETVFSYDLFTQYITMDGIDKIEKSDDSIIVYSNSTDPYLVWDARDIIDEKELANEISTKNLLAKIVACVLEVLIVGFFLKRYDELVEFPVQIYQNKKLIWQLAKNDFKTRYAGSYLGMVWAFIQPIVTILVYWFVFDIGLKSGQVMDTPFVLWLMAGLVPWFFFSEAWNSGTGALIEYQYLVKKVVFQINILPLVKVISALFVHVFFASFTVFLYACYGYIPDLYTLQIIYYSFCVLVFVLGLSYVTSAILAFFKDLSQIINILLQVGVWMTPIMWNIDIMGFPSWLMTIFKLNPMYYIVAGYRDSLINKVWFWEEPTLTLYFWAITICILGMGTLIFKKLKIHFADVL